MNWWRKRRRERLMAQGYRELADEHSAITEAFWPLQLEAMADLFCASSLNGFGCDSPRGHEGAHGGWVNGQWTSWTRG